MGLRLPQACSTASVMHQMVTVFSVVDQGLAEHMQCWGALVDMGAPGIVTVDIPFLPLRIPVPHAVLNRPLDAWRAITQQAHISSRSLLLAGGQAGLVPRLGSGSCFVTCAPSKCSAIALLRTNNGETMGVTGSYALSQNRWAGAPP